MSTESAKAFFDKIEEDPNLQKAVQNATAADLVQIGSNHGFDFTEQEIQDELRNRWGMDGSKADPSQSFGPNSIQTLCSPSS